ncbi:di-heme oxidoredictase family protein [Allohahella sp. A8]|uniref:di-heme oxidoredictase family protein n=1 Tax=Allohahella sp. A8 TaxID=3141461 RepID=UPI003A7F84DB
MDLTTTHRPPAIHFALGLSLLSVALGSCSTSAAELGRLLWEDNFNTLDSRIWNVVEGDGCEQGLCGWGNQELEWYKAGNSFTANGQLILEAKREPGLAVQHNGKAFTSGKIDTKNKLSVQYGMIEVRMQQPVVGTGLWPAAWMLGTSDEPWPKKGEIDMMESGHRAQGRAEAGFSGADINSFVGANVIFYADAACSDGNPTCAASTAWQNDNAYLAPAPLSNRFVTYRTYWTDSQIRFSILDNGVETDLYEQPITINDDMAALRKPFYLLLNLAVGGNFTDAATNQQVTAPLPAQMKIDYIRIYELDGQGQVWVETPDPQSGVLRVEAESYDRFVDTTPGNSGGAYRNDDVDIEQTSDEGGGHNVGWMDAGDWLEFDVDLPAGNYDLSARVASAVGGGRYRVSVDGRSAGSNTVSSTGGWQSFQTQPLGTLTLDSSGRHTLRVAVDSAALNLNWLEFTPKEGPSRNDDVSGVTEIGSGEIEFFVNTAGWADLHYSLNDGGQINVRMPQQSGRNSFKVSGLTAGDRISYFFTYFDAGINGAVDSSRQTFTVGSGGGSDGSDNGGDNGGVDGGDSDGGDGGGTDGGNGGGNGGNADGGGGSNGAGKVVPLFGPATQLEPAIQVDRGDALVTRFSDRARDRHAKENHFQAYDHYLSFYWEDRTAAIEIVDRVAKGGNSIRMNVRAENKLDDLQAENRWWYIGTNTLAEFCGNGVMTTNDNRNYWKEETYNCREGRPIQKGDKLEFEISQFLDERTLPRGRSNYYGTTFLYIVGEGIVPWSVTDKTVFTPGRTLQRDSVPIPQRARLGGDTTLHVQMTAEPDGHFQQMATNLGYENGQPFVQGRRVHHTSFLNGAHDENPENGVFGEMSGKAGTHYINDRCAGCHVRNGRAPVAPNGEALDKWVFRIGDANGGPDPERGRVLQPRNIGINNASAGEGVASIAFWSESNGLRSPNYEFSYGAPETFSARIAPNINGIGLLEAIPEAAILAKADPDDRNGDGISGRAQEIRDPVTGESRLGRFGYKAGSFSVKHQVASAFNTDMGVMTTMLPSPDCGPQQVECGSSGAEIPDSEVNKLVKYISLLGVRPQRDYDNPEVRRGETVFNDIGCVGCHTPEQKTSQYHPLGELRNQTIRPYTDMLLHDMGPGLADNLGEGIASGSEWRTAPLWGLGLSACVTGGVTGGRGWDAFGLDGYERCTPDANFLHDGRARTIDEAIRWHGGEGEASKVAYEGLGGGDKGALLRFLESL